MYSILKLTVNGVTLAGPDCGSWGVPARGTSKRSRINSLGFPAFDFVARGNVMVSRLPGAIVAKLKFEQ